MTTWSRRRGRQLALSDDSMWLLDQVDREWRHSAPALRAVADTQTTHAELRGTQRRHREVLAEVLSICDLAANYYEIEGASLFGGPYETGISLAGRRLHESAEGFRSSADAAAAGGRPLGAAGRQRLVALQSVIERAERAVAPHREVFSD